MKHKTLDKIGNLGSILAVVGIYTIILLFLLLPSKQVLFLSTIPILFGVSLLLWTALSYPGSEK